MKFPIRHNNHSLEEQSITFLRQHLPHDWNINTIDRDYGQDINLEIAEQGVYKGSELVLQLKSSQNSNATNNLEKQVFKVSTYNYLWGNLRVVMLIKFVKELNEAFYILLKDVPSPNQNQDTFTIYLPSANRLSEIDWNEITKYVKFVTNKKLSAMLPVDIQE